MQNDETTPKYVGYVENRLVYNELSLNLESKVNDIRLS
jgi:hypothetical protein